MTDIPERLRRLVRERAEDRCEYCLIHEAFTFSSHEPDHIIAEKHGCETAFENLAWACFFCNRHQGSDISSLDPLNGHITPLFHPRKQQWRRHFRLNGPFIEPLTASGRATAHLLQFTIPPRIEDRRELMTTGDYP